MRVLIDADEGAYPTYELSNSCGAPVDVPPGTVKRWKRILEEYQQVQDEMQAFYENAECSEYDE
jgi:hypothetical protein